MMLMFKWLVGRGKVAEVASVQNRDKSCASVGAVETPSSRRQTQVWCKVLSGGVIPVTGGLVEAYRSRKTGGTWIWWGTWVELRKSCG